MPLFFPKTNPMIDPKIKIISNEILSDSWYTLRKVTYEYQKKDGHPETQIREVYDRGNGAVILLYNKSNQSVILTRPPKPQNPII